LPALPLNNRLLSTKKAELETVGPASPLDMSRRADYHPLG